MTEISGDRPSAVRERMARDADRQARRAAWIAEGLHFFFYVVGIAAVTAGLIGAAAAALAWPAWVPPVAALVAGLLAGAQTLWTFEERANFHWARSADLRAISREADLLTSPTEEQVRALSDRLHQVESRQLGAGARKAAS
jgi:hypothetical protein